MIYCIQLFFQDNQHYGTIGVAQGIYFRAYALPVLNLISLEYTRFISFVRSYYNSVIVI